MKTLLLFVCLPVLTIAASLRVTVSDPSNSVIASASVRVSVGKAKVTGTTTELGVVAFPDVATGRGTIHIEVPGFTSTDQDIRINAGENELQARLTIAPLQAVVVVGEDPRESATDPRGGSSTLLTTRDLAAFSDDPDVFQQQLEAMAGPGAVFRVNGFLGGRLPPKSQIQSIRFRMTPYSAEEHDDGLNPIEITTFPGAGEWHGQVAYAYRADTFGARNFFSPVREPMSLPRLDLVASGPLIANKTSASLSYSRTSGYDSQATVGVLPSGLFSDVVRLPSETINADGRINQRLPRAHLLLLEYQYAQKDVSSIGTTDLPDRLSSTFLRQNVVRIADSGLIGSKLINNLRFQFQWSGGGANSVSPATAIVVPGVFNQGGAGQDSSQRTRDMDFTEAVTFNHGIHNFRAGLEVDSAWRYLKDLTNANGTFTFSSLAAYEAGIPLQYTQRAGTTPVSYSQKQFSAFIQDDIRLRQNLSISLGLRYETQTAISDRLKFAPRVGFAWSPFRSGKTTFRGGLGIYPQWLDPSVYQQILLLNGLNQSNLLVLQPGYPDPYSGLATHSSTLPPSIYRLNPHVVMPYLWRASFSVQQQIGKLFMATADFRSQRGVHLLWSQDINAPLPAIGRPDPSAGQIWDVQSGANSSLNSWTVRLLGPGHPTQRYLWTVSYSYSRSMNNTDAALTPASSSYNLAADWGPSSGTSALSPLDIRHRFTALGLWSLPKGFQLGTVFRANSGAPYNITTGFDNNGDGVVNDRPAGISRNSARGSSLVDLDLRVSWSKSIGEGRKETTQSLIRLSDAGVPDLPPGLGSNPRLLLQIYSQATNLMNHANLTNFIGVETSPLFGQPTSALPGRRLELGIKLSF
jgi:hypothetical protein